MGGIGGRAHFFTYLAQLLFAAGMAALSLLAPAAWRLALLLILAAAAAILAVVYPMRGLEERGTARIVMTVALLLLAILVLLTVLDVETRDGIRDSGGGAGGSVNFVSFLRARMRPGITRNRTTSSEVSPALPESRILTPDPRLLQNPENTLS